MNDPVVRRVNALITTFLDLLAVLLLAGASGYGGWTYGGPWLGMLCASGIIVIASAYAQHRATPRTPTPEPPDDVDDLPGPTDPGNLHVMGR